MRMAWKIAGIGVLGSAGFLGCGDPVPPAAQAGISIHIQEYDPMDPNWGGKNCPPYRHWINVPYDHDRSPSSQKQLTDANNATRAVNNQDGDTVSCSVTPKGSGFSVTGKGSAYAEFDGRKYKPSTVHIRIPEIREGDTNAKGSLTIQDDTSINQYSTELCSYSVQGSSFGVEAGKIWGSVTCDGLMDASVLEAACHVDTGFFVFENCAK
jgi:hypothetical protein